MYKSFEYHIFVGSIFIVIFLGGFYFLVKYHEKLEDQMAANKSEEKLLENEIVCLENHENSVYYNGKDFADSGHIYSEDLDLFGNGSLFQFINRAKTKSGIDFLAKNLLTIESDAINIVEKQNAAKEIKDNTKWRLKFQASLFNIAHNEKNYSEIISNLGLPPKMQMERFIGIYAKILPFIWAAVFVYSYLTAFAFFGYMIGAIFIVNFYLGNINRKLTASYLNELSLSGNILKSYTKASELIANQSFEANLLKNALSDFPASELNSKNPIEDFAVILKRLDIRRNMLAAIFMTFVRPFEPIEIINLGNWLKKNPDFFKRIFKTIGLFEYYASLSSAAFNNPKWAFPTFDVENGEYILAKEVGHPLIRGHATVSNDFVLNTKNKLNLITGSNMSGKSTFLRTLGINVILGNIGGPVFAEKLSFLPSLTPVCYMRITDNLNQNASTFKAEIERIKLVLAAMQQKKNHLFLIDEMLRGTNSEDKLTGSMALLEKIVTENALAFVATHDLRLTDISVKYPEKVKNYFFEYSSENGDLTFDYLIKEGVCNSFNASQLLAAIGLDMSHKIV
jgi:DNA mismatch repair ATPase MutS